MKEERLQILHMIQEQVISAEEGAKLLRALSERDERQRQPPQRAEVVGRTRRWLRIRVTDNSNERDRVSVTLPLSLLDWGLKMAEMIAGVNLVAVREVIHGGAEGKIIEIEDSESNGRVEIFVE